MDDLELKQIASDITQRIQQLSSLSDMELRGEMSALKKSLLENPAACSLLLDEDIGELVKALRKVTGQAAITASEKKASPKKATEKKLKGMTAEELNKALNEVSDDEW